MVILDHRPILNTLVKWCTDFKLENFLDDKMFLGVFAKFFYHSVLNFSCFTYTIRFAFSVISFNISQNFVVSEYCFFLLWHHICFFSYLLDFIGSPGSSWFDHCFAFRFLIADCSKQAPWINQFANNELSKEINVCTKMVTLFKFCPTIIGTKSSIFVSLQFEIWISAKSFWYTKFGLIRFWTKNNYFWKLPCFRAR